MATCQGIPIYMLTSLRGLGFVWFYAATAAGASGKG